MDDTISDIGSEVKSTNFVFYFSLLPLRKKTERYASLMLESCFIKMGVYLLLHPCHVPLGYHLIVTEAIQGLYATPIRLPCREYQADATLALFGSWKTDAKCRKSRFWHQHMFFVWNSTFFTRIIIKDIKIISMLGLRASMTMYSARLLRHLRAFIRRRKNNCLEMMLANFPAGNLRLKFYRVSAWAFPAVSMFQKYIVQSSEHRYSI